MSTVLEHPYENIDLLYFSNQNIKAYKNIRKFEYSKNVNFRFWGSSAKVTIGVSPYYLSSQELVCLDVYSNPAFIDNISTHQIKYYLLDQHFARYHHVVRNLILTVFNYSFLGKDIQIRFDKKYFSTYFLNAFLQAPQHIAHKLTFGKSKDYFVSIYYDEYLKYYELSRCNGPLWLITQEQDYYLEVKDIYPVLKGENFIKFFQYLDNRIEYPKETIRIISKSNEYMWYYLLSFTLLYRFNHTFINLFSDSSMLGNKNFKQLAQVLQGKDIEHGYIRDKIIECFINDDGDGDTELEKIEKHYIRCVEKQKEAFQIMSKQ